MNQKVFERKRLWSSCSICLEQLRKTTETLVRIVGVLAEMRTKHPQEYRGLEQYHSAEHDICGPTVNYGP
jgi:hypothetical protein